MGEPTEVELTASVQDSLKDSIPFFWWLKRVLIESARAAARTKGTYCYAQYARIAKRRGPNKAVVAVAHSMLDTTWYLLTNGTLWQDPGADYFDRRHDPAIEAKKMAERIIALGDEVTVTQQIA